MSRIQSPKTVEEMLEGGRVYLAKKAAGEEILFEDEMVITVEYAVDVCERILRLESQTQEAV